MPEGHLHAIVDGIAAAGSEALARRAAEGAAVPFDLIEAPSETGGAPLFSYRPRTRDFVEEHADVLRHLPAWPAAVNVLAGYDGLGDYLLARGEHRVPIDARDRADLVLRVLLAEMHGETGDFLYTPARATEAAQRLERCVMAGQVEGVVVVPLLGVRLREQRLELGDGITLMRDDALAGLPRQARSSLPGRPGTLVTVTTLEDPAETATLARARPRLRALLTALRLYDAPSPALAPVAWTRVRGDGWASAPFIGTCARATGTLELGAEQADAIRAFCAHIADHAPELGPAAWALRRFELACERADHGEALTDVLLALRALLATDGNRPLAPGHDDELLGRRLGALCASPGARDGVAALAGRAAALERALIAGEPADAPELRGTALELRGHLRALLRDLACGHLSDDLGRLAERILAEAAVETLA